MHAERVRRHGDPQVSNTGSGAANPRWRGDAVTYAGAHLRIRAVRGPASEHGCIDCGRPAAHWSYDRSDPHERAGPDGPYSTDSQHYQPRCVPCHKRFDLAARDQSEHPTTRGAPPGEEVDADG